MKTNRCGAGIWIVWFLCVVLFSLSGCGYTVYRQSDLPFTEIQIGKIENKTLEPKLQDKLYAAFAEEFMKNGIRVSPGADTRLSAVIHTFDMTILSEKKEITIAYVINMRADFSVEDKNGKRELKKIDSPFIVTLTGSEALNTLLAAKELAEEEAVKDVAMRVAGALIYK